MIAGLPQSVGGRTLNRSAAPRCRRSIWRPARSRPAGRAFICVGMESMTWCRRGASTPRPTRMRGQHQTPTCRWARRPRTWRSSWNVAAPTRRCSRSQSHQKADAAPRAGPPADEIVADHAGQASGEDGCIRPSTIVEALAGAEAGVRRRGSGHGRHLLATDRRRLGGAGHERRFATRNG